MKPENILLDANGNIKLADFGVCKVLDEPKDRTSSLTGTQQYLAPEMYFSQNGYSWSCDCWSLGCTLYEMVVGHPPFPLHENIEEQERIVRSMEIDMKDYFSKNFKSLLNGLLAKKIPQRLTVHTAKQHPFFKSIDWEKLVKGELKPPIRPKVKNAWDDKYINKKILKRDFMVESTIRTSIMESNCDGTSNSDTKLMFESVISKKKQFQGFSHHPDTIFKNVRSPRNIEED